MFKLTPAEQKVVAFLLGVVLLGTVVKTWRAEHPTAPATPASQQRNH